MICLLSDFAVEIVAKFIFYDAMNVIECDGKEFCHNIFKCFCRGPKSPYIHSIIEEHTEVVRSFSTVAVKAIQGEYNPKTVPKVEMQRTFEEIIEYRLSGMP